MSTILSIREPSLELPDIKIPLEQTTPEESGDGSTKNFSQVMQTKVTGTIMPLIALNGIAIGYTDLIEFRLDWTSHIPEVEFVFVDREGTFSQFSKPGISNELQVQILPNFDGAYKKVNLLFYVTEILIDFGQVRGKAKYKVLDLIQGRFISLGELSTFELFDKISLDTGVGFASNVLSSNDMRFIYAPTKSYLDIIRSEIENSASDENCVFDWWIDLWNNLVFCDMLDRYSSEDKEEDMKVWVSNRLNDPMAETTIEPYKTSTVFTNTPYSHNTELYIQEYSFNNTPSSYTTGTSKIVSVYSEETHDYLDNYIMDGDSEDEFLTHEYGGEFYGPYNYIVAKQCRNIYLKKVYGETMSIFTNYPLLGISRGDQVRVVWYDADTITLMKMKQARESGCTTIWDSDLGWLNSFMLDVDDESGLLLNVNVSGQYTVIGEYFTFMNNQWTVEYVLGRPSNKKTPPISELEYVSSDS